MHEDFSLPVKPTLSSCFDFIVKCKDCEVEGNLGDLSPSIGSEESECAGFSIKLFLPKKLPGVGDINFGGK
jgi:hypothetical protein